MSALVTRGQQGVRTSVDVVYGHTRAAIVRGVYPPGAPLKIQELAETNSVSLTPVREALRVLAAEGFVEAVRNRVVRVAPISRAEILDIYNVRAQLEVAALRLAFEHLTPVHIRKANELNRQCVDLLREGDERFFEIHEALHFMLYDQCQSKWLMRFITTVWAHSERCRWLSSPPHVDLEDAEQQHVELLKALGARDLEGSLRALEAHIKHNLEVLLRVQHKWDMSSPVPP